MSDRAEPAPELDAESWAARVADLERRLAEAEARAETTGPPPLRFQALRLLDHGWGEGWELRPGPARRAWMSAEPTIYQCLPMVAANQWGWQVLCPTPVVAHWDGSDAPGGLAVEVDPRWAPAIKSRFGRGIVTFSPPWLFRTSAGWDLYAKGPSNRWKANCAPLEGVVETWWLPYTFTLNWKIIEPGTVRFERGESVGQLVPVPHATFPGIGATESPIAEVEPATAAELVRWRDERRRIAATSQPTHRNYLRAEEVEGHLTRIPVPPITRTWVGPVGDGPPPT